MRFVASSFFDVFVFPTFLQSCHGMPCIIGGYEDDCRRMLEHMFSARCLLSFAAALQSNNSFLHHCSLNPKNKHTPRKVRKECLSKLPLHSAEYKEVIHPFTVIIYCITNPHGKITRGFTERLSAKSLCRPLSSQDSMGLQEKQKLPVCYTIVLCI